MTSLVHRLKALWPAEFQYTMKRDWKGSSSGQLHPCLTHLHEKQNVKEDTHFTNLLPHRITALKILALRKKAVLIPHLLKFFLLSRFCMSYAHRCLRSEEGAESLVAGVSEGLVWVMESELWSSGRAVSPLQFSPASPLCYLPFSFLADFSLNLVCWDLRYMPPHLAALYLYSSYSAFTSGIWECGFYLWLMVAFLFPIYNTYTLYIVCM